VITVTGNSEVKVGMNKSSLNVTVMEAISTEFNNALLREQIYVDNSVLVEIAYFPYYSECIF